MVQPNHKRNGVPEVSLGPKSLGAITLFAVFAFCGLFLAREPATYSSAAVGATPERIRPTFVDHAPSEPLPGNDASISLQPLPIFLISTEPSARPGDARTTLGTDARNSQTYRLGAVLANGARLSQVTPDRVVLERDGSFTTLRVGATESRHSKVNAIASIGGAPPERVAFQESIEPVTDLIRPRPIYDSTGRFAAYEIQPANSSANLARLGLMPGDRLVAVNGVALASSEDGAAVLQALYAGDAIEAEIVRGRTALRITLKGERLAQADGS